MSTPIPWLAALVEAVIPQARTTLLRDQGHHPILMAFTPAGELMSVAAVTGDDFRAALEAHAAERVLVGAAALILISECWMGDPTADRPRRQGLLVLSTSPAGVTVHTEELVRAADGRIVATRPSPASNQDLRLVYQALLAGLWTTPKTKGKDTP